MCVCGQPCIHTVADYTFMSMCVRIDFRAGSSCHTLQTCVSVYHAQSVWTRYTWLNVRDYVFPAHVLRSGITMQILFRFKLSIKLVWR